MSGIEVVSARLTREETEDLKRAIACLEGASFAQRLTDALGRPIGMLSRNAPASARNAVARVSEAALGAALKLALRTIDRNGTAKPAGRAHTLAAAASGAVGGAFGLAALPVELPLSTAIVMRSIAEIARQEGEDLAPPTPRSPASKSLRLAEKRKRPPSRADISPSAPRSPSPSARAPAFSRPRVARPSRRRRWFVSSPRSPPASA